MLFCCVFSCILHQVMFQMDQILRTLLGQAFLHTEVDLTSLVVLCVDASDLDIRLMPSPIMQKLVSHSSKGLIVHRPAGKATSASCLSKHAVNLASVVQ